MQKWQYQFIATFERAGQRGRLNIAQQRQWTSQLEFIELSRKWHGELVTRESITAKRERGRKILRGKLISIELAREREREREQSVTTIGLFDSALAGTLIAVLCESNRMEPGEWVSGQLGLCCKLQEENKRQEGK